MSAIIGAPTVFLGVLKTTQKQGPYILVPRPKTRRGIPETKEVVGSLGLTHSAVWGLRLFVSGSGSKAQYKRHSDPK